MNFKEATDNLFDGVDQPALANEIGVSVASIRQARLNPQAKAYRNPPQNWERSLIRIAEREIMRYRKLIEELRD